MKLVGLIIAKGQSRRLPGKNLRELKGLPMFLWNMKKCIEVFGECYVSSDSEEILRLTAEHGGKPIKRPEELCGETPDIPVFQHAISQMSNVDGIVAVHANNPMIKKETIELVKNILELGTPEVMSCYPMTEKKFYKKQGNPINGSIRGFHVGRLKCYKDPYHPQPEVLVVDDSLEIEKPEDYELIKREVTITGNETYMAQHMD